MKIIFWISCGAVAGILFIKKFPKLKIEKAKTMINQKVEESKKKINKIVKNITHTDNSKENKNQKPYNNE